MKSSVIWQLFFLMHLILCKLHKIKNFWPSIIQTKRITVTSKTKQPVMPRMDTWVMIQDEVWGTLFSKVRISQSVMTWDFLSPSRSWVPQPSNADSCLDWKWWTCRASDFTLHISSPILFGGWRKKDGAYYRLNCDPLKRYVRALTPTTYKCDLILIGSLLTLLSKLEMRWLG